MPGHEKNAPETWHVRVCLVVSSFRNDASVERILDKVHATGRSPFASIIVVDSLGTGRIPALVSDRAWDDVEYRSYDTNLGSAGNLAERLRLAAAAGADFAYAINHDGDVNLETVRKLVAYAVGHPRTGAVYPLRRLTANGGSYEVTGASRLPLPLIKRASRPVGTATPVHWSSSNGTLYSMEPVRRGLLPWADLWMGWEDLGYGWLLNRQGYEQVVLNDAPFDDNYEYASHRIGPARIRITNKPPWYAYYQMRNLLLVTRRTEQPLAARAVVAGRVAGEFVLTTLFRRDKLLRYQLLTAGVVDGLRNRAGKWRLP